MNVRAQTSDPSCPQWFRFSVIALGAIILCSCRSPQAISNAGSGACEHPQATHGGGEPLPMPMPGTLPASAYTGDMYQQYASAGGQWRPPGIGGSWPRDEYLHDGGDHITPATVLPDWSMRGLEPEDTVAHYDTLDGRTIVQPSNRVCIYAPRFAAVRSIDGVRAYAHEDRLAEFDRPEKLTQYDERQFATTAVQPIQPEGQLGTRAANIYRERQQGGGLASQESLASFHDGFMPYEDFSIIRLGIHQGAERPRLLEQIDAALVWTQNQAVQVILEGKQANELVNDQRVQVTYRFDHEGSPELRICKVASTHSAAPGETVDFTLRFDNTGSERIGNVVIIDNLTTRLAYVPDSAQSSLKAEFVAEENEVGSHVLRWELDEPLDPGKGGIIRFRAKVR